MARGLRARRAPTPALDTSRGARGASGLPAVASDFPGRADPIHNGSCTHSHGTRADRPLMLYVTACYALPWVPSPCSLTEHVPGRTPEHVFLSMPERAHPNPCWSPSGQRACLGVFVSSAPPHRAPEARGLGACICACLRVCYKAGISVGPRPWAGRVTQQPM